MISNKHLVLALGLLLATGASACKGSDESTPAPDKSPTAAATQAAPAAATTPTPAAPKAKEGEAVSAANLLEIRITHAEPKPDDPVVVTFKDIEIASASFDPADLTGATAELLVDMTTLSSGIPKRDGHLSTPDYLDTSSFPKTSIRVSAVKKSASDRYDATALVSSHGVEKSWPVSFAVVGRGQDGSITVEAEHAFRRQDFGIGKDEGDPAASEVKAKLRVTFPSPS